MTIAAIVDVIAKVETMEAPRYQNRLPGTPQNRPARIGRDPAAIEAAWLG